MIQRAGTAAVIVHEAPPALELAFGAGDGVDASEECLRSRVRETMGRGWVAEFRLRGEANGESLHHMVHLARETGRDLLVVTPRSEGELPPVMSGERWTAETLAGQLCWALRRPHRPGWQQKVKRWLDVALSGAGIIALSPVFLVVGMLIKMSSPGPVFYPLRHVGPHGRPFTGYKFRTMVQDADARKAELLAHNQMVGPVFKMANDPRVTRVGRWLRKYSLDELPQLWNVVKGDLSLVGPRPPSRHEYEQFELWQMRKVTVPQGLTCLWQVRGRNRISDFSEWVRMDLEYIDRWSLWLDLQILAQTALVVIKGTGY